MTPEGIVLKAVCQYLGILEAQGKLTFWRQNNGATYDPKKKTYRATTGTGYKYGVPDVVACIAPHGLLVAFEVKSKTGKPSESQDAFKSLLERVGGRYFIVRSVDDVIAALAP